MFTHNYPRVLKFSVLFSPHHSKQNPGRENRAELPLRVPPLCGVCCGSPNTRLFSLICAEVAPTSLKSVVALINHFDCTYLSNTKFVSYFLQECIEIKLPLLICPSKTATRLLSTSLTEAGAVAPWSLALHVLLSDASHSKKENQK